MLFLDMRWLQVNYKKIDCNLRRELINYYKHSRFTPQFLHSIINKTRYTFKKLNVLVEYDYNWNQSKINEKSYTSGSYTSKNEYKNANTLPLRAAPRKINNLLRKEYVKAIYLDTPNKPVLSIVQYPAASLNLSGISLNKQDTKFTSVSSANINQTDLFNKTSTSDISCKNSKDSEKTTNTPAKIPVKKHEDSIFKLYKCVIPHKVTNKTADKNPILQQAPECTANLSDNGIFKSEKPLLDIHFDFKSLKITRFW